MFFHALQFPAQMNAKQLRFAKTLAIPPTEKPSLTEPAHHPRLAESNKRPQTYSRRNRK